MSKVLELLPHTPVRAIGHNYQFTATQAEWGDRPQPSLGAKRRTFCAEQVSPGRRFSSWRCRVEITLGYESELAVVLFNFHRSMNLERASAARTPLDQISEARNAALCFQADFEESRSMLPIALRDGDS